MVDRGSKCGEVAHFKGPVDLPELLILRAPLGI
jgi:hypothetical protein